ncbi:MAG: D-aminoacyl-tRNA deacylase [Phycisphaerae bacterium]
MRAIVQRVRSAAVDVAGECVGRIGPGMLVYLGVAGDDSETDADFLADKVRHLRIFPDAAGKMNLDVAEAGGAVLVVSNFTLLADCRAGRRPAFDAAARPELADRLYQHFCAALRRSIAVETGQFRAMMQVSAVNDGPINVLLDSKRAF